MSENRDDLYRLLPAIYRERDAERGYQLQALLSILSAQGAVVDADIAQLYENLFIETCQDWVVPYIGDLVSNRALYDAGRITQPDTAKTLFPDLAGTDLLPPLSIRARADVANTIYYRQRKATPAMLEELARDVTGWAAHVVEFFQLLGWTQFLEHRRPQCQWVDVRSIDRMQRIDGAFDVTSHTVDVRRPAPQEGWHNIRNLGFFFWRLQSYQLAMVPARPATLDWQYHFSPLGNNAPLFTRLRPESMGTGLVTEIDIAAPIRPILFYEDLHQSGQPGYAGLYGAFDGTLASLHLTLNGLDVAAAHIVCMRLDPWPAAPPTGRIVGVDVTTGRLAIGDGWGVTGPVDASYFYGFSSGLGGGTYDRRKWLEDRSAANGSPAVYTVLQNGASGHFAKNNVLDAVTQWIADGQPRAIISILDNRTYALPAAIELANDGWLAIEADNEVRPLLQTGANGLQVSVTPPADPADVDRTASLTLNGIVLEGNVDVIGDLGQLRLLHSTLIPGRQLDGDGNPMGNGASLIVAAQNAGGQEINLQLSVQAAFSIIGRIEVPQPATGIWLFDCIVQGIGGVAVSDAAGNYAPSLTTERSTVIGTVQAKSLQASETIFTAPVGVQRTQAGCVRFSYVPPGSKTPRRYRCQPDLGIAEAIAAALSTNPSLSSAIQAQIALDVEAQLVPALVTTRYGQPAYAQLSLACPWPIRTGAEDGSEMGAFCHLKQPQRASNLQLRLSEYLPFGLDAAIVYVT
jgi:hypothetical protein